MDTQKKKYLFIHAVAYAYILLFTYAAASKLLDYDNFLLQLGQSPLMTAFATPVSIAVPAIELIIVLLLSFSKTRLSGLFAALLLMVMFTAYIFIILNYSSYVPCSCGGILEKMGWTEHLLFNCIFVALALVAFLLEIGQTNGWWSRLKPFTLSFTLTAAILMAFGTIVGLFLISEKIVHERNTFVRRFPVHELPEDKKIDLKVNSYYFAGHKDGLIYLGNYTAPFTVTIIDTALSSSRLIRIKPDSILKNYRALQLRTLHDQFYLADGTLPCLYQGSTEDWRAKLQPEIPNTFTTAEPIDKNRMAFRQLSATTTTNIIGTLTYKDSIVRKVNQKLLKKQQAGFFDTDGMLLYNHELQQLHYVYFYRNQYLSIDKELNLISTGRTIDTVTRADIKVTKLENGESTMARPPLIINKSAAAYQNLLFIQSERIGKFDRAEKLQKAALIDFYDLTTGNYQASFYLSNIGTEKVKSFMVIGSKAYYLSGNHLVVLNLSSKITRYYKEGVAPSH